MEQIVSTLVIFLRYILTFTLLSMLLTPLAFAQVIMNEVMPAPSSGNEWVELKNIGSQAVDLSGWSVEDANGVLQPSPSFSAAVIEPGAFFVFELINKLNNTGDTVTLKNMAAQVIDQFSYSTSSPELSWSRVSSTQSAFIAAPPSRGAENTLPSPSPIPSTSPVPTPTQSPLPTPSPSPTVLPSVSPAVPSPSTVGLPSPVVFPTPSTRPTLHPLHLSEVLACPETSAKEWVEFYNPNPLPLLLQDWKLQDRTGNTRNLELEMPAQGYALFELSTGIFNNDGDTLLIFNAEGNELIRVELPACTKGESTVYTTQGWQQTTEPTPLQKNSIRSVEADEPSTQLELETGTPLWPTETQAYSEELLPLLPDSLGSLFEAQERQQTPQDDASSEDLTASENKYTLPELVASSPMPVPSTDHDHSNSPEQTVSGSSIPSKAWIVSLFGLSIALIALGSFGLHQWYTERYVKDSLEAF